MKLMVSDDASVGCGLKNLGNSCYISAVMQCLATVDECNTSVAGDEDLEKFVLEYGNLIKKLRCCKEKVVTQ